MVPNQDKVERSVDRRTVLKSVGAAMALGTAGVGSVSAHRPSPVDWYSHKIIGCTGDEVVIEDSLPGGNVFTVPLDKALNHIRNDHGWTEVTIARFSVEVEKLCLGLEPDWDVLAWYSHTIVDCREGSDQRYVTVKDGLGYKFEIGYGFFTDHIAHDHGWSQEDQNTFFDAMDHYCSHNA